MNENFDLDIKALLGKYMIARDCMEAVVQASGIALVLEVDHTHVLYRSLHDEIVISYGRAFTEIRPLGKLPGIWSKFDNDSLTQTHKKLMYHRSKNVGHVDIIPGRIRLHPVGTLLENGRETENVNYTVLTQSIPFSSDEMIAIRHLAGNLTGRLMA